MSMGHADSSCRGFSLSSWQIIHQIEWRHNEYCFQSFDEESEGSSVLRWNAEDGYTAKGYEVDDNWNKVAQNSYDEQ